MAHSSAAVATAGEINYFYQDENGKILKVLRQSDIKQEPVPGTSTVYASTVNSANMGAYNQMSTSNQPQYIRIQNSSNYNQAAENNTYTVIAPHSSNSNSMVHQQQTIASVKYEQSDNYNGTHSSMAKPEERHTKYAQNNIKNKSKIHTVNHSSSSTHTAVQRKRKPEKAGKGLRHFSLKVCEKVKEKGTTTYNEVADELVNEEIQNNSFDSNCDQKNIRRRVYDALNVLMAIQIISKDKKEIRWIGLPSTSHEQCTAVEKENEECRERIRQKHQQLRELLLQQVSFKSLIERNKDAECQGIVPTPNSSIQLPFIIVNTHKSTKINCSVTNDKSEYIFKFDDQFEMHDDAEVLKRMGLLLGLDKGTCSYEDIERAKTLVPPSFAKYIDAYGNGQECDEDDDKPTYVELTNDAQGFSRTVDGVKRPDLDDDDDDFQEHSDVD